LKNQVFSNSGRPCTTKNLQFSFSLKKTCAVIVCALSTTLTSSKATFLIDQASVNPSLMTDWKGIIHNGTGSWQETLTVPASNKYFFAFLLNDSVRFVLRASHFESHLSASVLVRFRVLVNTKAY